MRLREIKTHKIFDDSLVDKDRKSDAENSDESEVATGPSEVMLEILSRRSPIFDELVLVRFHSSTHLLRFFFRSTFSLLLLRFLNSKLCDSLSLSRKKNTNLFDLSFLVININILSNNDQILKWT